MQRVWQPYLKGGAFWTALVLSVASLLTTARVEEACYGAGLPGSWFAWEHLSAPLLAAALLRLLFVAASFAALR